MASDFQGVSKVTHWYVRQHRDWIYHFMSIGPKLQCHELTNSPSPKRQTEETERRQMENFAVSVITTLTYASPVLGDKESPAQYSKSNFLSSVPRCIQRVTATRHLIFSSTKSQRGFDVRNCGNDGVIYNSSLTLALASPACFLAASAPRPTW
jgi:hypothetical protein